jgi:hypothetical protein
MRVEEAMQRVRFVPNSAARALRGAVSSLVLIAVPDLRVPFARGVVSAFDTSMASHGLRTQIIDRIEDEWQAVAFEARTVGACAWVTVRFRADRPVLSLRATWLDDRALELVASRRVEPHDLLAFTAGEVMGMRAAAELLDAAPSGRRHRSAATGPAGD